MRLFSRKDKSPGWWKSDEREWAQFCALLEGHLSDKGVSFTAEYDTGQIKLEGGAVVGLTNVAAIWPTLAPADRQGHVARFLDTVLSAGQGVKAGPDPAAALRVSVYPGEFLPEADWVARIQPCESLQAVVMLDFEGGAQVVRLSDLEGWGLTLDEALERAKQNTFKHEPYNVDRQQIEGQGTLTIVHGDSMFTAAQVLDIERFLIPACDLGAIVAVPNRHFVAFVRCDEPNLEGSIRVLLTFASAVWNDGQYLVTPDLVWCRGGEMTTVGRPTDTGYELGLPDELRSSSS
jgi:hypothetical protein